MTNTQQPLTRFVILISDRGQDTPRIAEPDYATREAAEQAAARLRATGRYNSVQVREA